MRMPYRFRVLIAKIAAVYLARRRHRPYVRVQVAEPSERNGKGKRLELSGFRVDVRGVDFRGLVSTFAVST